MKATIRIVAMVTAIGLVSGCSGQRRFERPMGNVRLPSAPTLEPGPAVAPDQTGAVGTPEPRAESRVPTQSPFDN